MQIRAICKKLSVLVGLVGTLLSTADTWASTRMGNAELQMWYRMRHTFHTNSRDSVNWVQWRKVDRIRPKHHWQLSSPWKRASLPFRMPAAPSNR